jgi:cell division protein FtsI/penicillin-binding protein 2
MINMSKKLLEKHPSHKEFIVKTEIITKFAFKAVALLVVITLVLYQVLFALSYLGLTAYQEYKQEQASQKQQDSLKQLQQDKK